MHVYQQGQGDRLPDDIRIQGLNSPEARKLLGHYADDVQLTLRRHAHPKP